MKTQSDSPKILFAFFLVLFLGSVVHLKALPNLAGLRDVQIRSDRVVTVWLGYMATTDSSKLYNTALYTIASSDDPEFKEAVHPVKMARFMKGSRSANGPFDWRALQDQMMHLYVDKPFKKGCNYYVTLGEGLIPGDMPHTGAFSLDLTPNPSFKVNQVGYTHTARTKHIYLSSYLGDGEPVDLSGHTKFQIVNASTKKQVYQGDILQVSEKDLQGNDALYKLDISSLKEDGYFYAEIEGFGRSYVFQNGSGPALEMMKLAGRGMYFQRCGAELVPPFCGQWPHAMSHDKIYVTKKNIVHPWDLEVEPSDPDAGDYYVPEGPREIHGGHHDAGDYDTRLTHLAIPEQFLSMYVAMPQKFHDGQIFIPENNNGIPDILDEVAWSLLHYEYLQDYHGEVRSDFGAIAGGMESYTHPPKWPVTGSGDALPYYMRKATPYTTFSVAAVFALASRAFEVVDPGKSARYLRRAKAGYEWAVLHQDEKWDPENPKVLPLDWEEVYDDGQLDAAWSWAAGQMFETTGEDLYMKDFESHYKTATKLTFDKLHGFWPLIASQRANVNRKVQEELKNLLLASAQETLDMVASNASNGYAAACPNKGDWGFSMPIANIEIINRAFMLTGDQKYLDAIATSIDFMMGMNPSEICWMTGAGSVSPMDPLHINSKYDGVEEPVPGILIYGPNENWNHDQNPLYPDPENMGFYRRIADVWGYVRGCEFVTDDQIANMYWAAGLMLE